MDEIVAKYTGDTYLTDVIVCPWCGTKYEDCWEWDDDGKEVCDACEREFSYERHVDVSYITRKEE